MFLEHPLVPKNRDGKLRTVIPGRVSTIAQDKECITVTQDGNEEWLAKAWNGPVVINKLGEQASGWLVERPSMEKATHLIETGQCDLVLMGEIRELYRNPRLIWQFIQNCLDHDTRVISRFDRIDTAVEGWESAVNDACGRYGSTRPETRRRVQGKAAHDFKRGGMVSKTKFGYRKLTKEEADSGKFGPVGLRIVKLAECTETIREMRRRVLANHSDVMVADWLKNEGVSPGPYATEWSGQLVRELLTDPILSGMREYRKTVSKLIYRRGKNRTDRNPSPLQSEKWTELAHLTLEEQEDLLRFYSQRKKKNRGNQKSGRDSPLYGQQRGVSLWPGQSITCSACRGKFYVCGNAMKCQYALPKNPGECWNHVIVPTQAVRDTVLPILLAAILRDPTAKTKLLAITWEEYQSRRRKWSSTQSADETELAETNRRIARLVKALMLDDGLDAVREELTLLEKNKKCLVAKLAKRAAPEFEFGEYASADAMGGDLPRVLDLMTRTSRPFALLLRGLLPECSIVPVQALDSCLVRPRLRFTISFAPWAGPLEQAYEEQHEVDLFTPPMHIQHVETCRRAQREHPGKTLREIAALLGINYMTVKRALDYDRLIDREGLTEPYRLLTEKPELASRWKKRRSKPDDDPPMG